MNFLKFVILLCLIFWLGSIFFFGAVMAPTLFKVLPTHALAGAVVNPSLDKLHWIGLACGIVFLICSCVHSSLTTGRMRVFRLEHLCIAVMLALTMTSLFAITPRLLAIRDSIGIIDNVPLADPRRAAFDSLHVWSVKIEQAVMLLGLVVTYATARRKE